MAKNKTLRNASIAIGSFLLVLLLVVLAGNFVQQTTFSGSSFCAAPIWNTLKCGRASNSISTFFSVTANQNSVDISCGEKELIADGDTCRVRFMNTSAFLSSLIQVVYAKGYICDMVDGQFKCPTGTKLGWRFSTSNQFGLDMIEIPKGKGLRITDCETDLFINKDCSFKKEAKPFRLEYVNPYKLVNGVNCDLTGSFNFAEKIGDVKIVDKNKVTGRDSFMPGEAYPFIEATAIGICDNRVIHPEHGEVICSGNALYKTKQILYTDGRTDTIQESGTSTPSGTRIDGLGDFIAEVQCCPQNNLFCDAKTFTTKPDEPEKTVCSSDAACGGGKLITKSAKCGYRYKCVQNRCAQQEDECFECMTNAACGGDRPICEPNSHTCVSGGGGQYCGDGNCQPNEDSRTCPRDCGNPPIVKTDWATIVLFASIALIGGVLAGSLIKRTMKSKGKGR